MATEWIELYDTETGEVESSWIRSVGWNDGDLIVRHYDNDPEDPETVLYDDEDVEREIFEKIQQIYRNGGSVGSAVNEHIVRNEDIDHADVM